MKIWRLEVDFQDYESFKLINEDRQYLKKFKELIFATKEFGNDFEAEQIELVEGENKTDCPKFWSASGTPLLSKNATEVLCESLGDDVELIPVQCGDEIYFIVNVLSALDAIDSEKSVFRKLATGLVVGLEEYILIPEVIKNHSIFKLMLNDRIMTTEVFVNEEFKDKVESNKLKGFKFVEVWSE